MTQPTPITVRALYVINDPPTSLFERFGGLKGMVQNAVKKIQTSDQFKHLDPFLTEHNQLLQVEIDEIHPYVHRFDKEAAAKLFPSVKEILGEEEGKRKYDCVLLSGSKFMVTDKNEEGFMIAEAAWVKELIASDKIPILGTCWGHQLIGDILGAPCKKHPTGGEWGSFEVNFHLDNKEVSSDPVFGRIARFAPSVSLQICHSQSVTNIPPNSGITVLGSSKDEPVHFVRFNKKTYGVQGHPEYRTEYLKANLTEEYGEEKAKKMPFQKDEDDFSAAILTNFFYFALHQKS